MGWCSAAWLALPAVLVNAWLASGSGHAGRDGGWPGDDLGLDLNCSGRIGSYTVVLWEKSLLTHCVSRPLWRLPGVVYLPRGVVFELFRVDLLRRRSGRLAVGICSNSG